MLNHLAAFADSIREFITAYSVRVYTGGGRFLGFPTVSYFLLMLFIVMRFYKPPGLQPKKILLTVTVISSVLIASLFATQMVGRSRTSPVLFVHDGAVQTEDAIRALRSGENPYTIDYSTRVFGMYPDVFSEATRPNPAWTHYVYLPFLAVLGVPFQSIFEHVFHWFDIRVVSILSFVLLVVSASLLVQDEKKRIGVVLFSLLNPLFLPFVVTGYNDVFFLGWIALGALFLQRKRFTWAGVALGLAFASKQFAWPLIPFYIAYVYATSARRSIRMTLQSIAPAVLVSVAVLLPFVLWSSDSFVDDIFRYASGSATYSYPISGWGFGQMLLFFGWVRSMWDNFPFWIPQLVIGLPLLGFLLRWFFKRPMLSTMLAAYGILGIVLSFFSRYFNDSHVGVYSVIFLFWYAVRGQPEREELHA